MCALFVVVGSAPPDLASEVSSSTGTPSSGEQQNNSSPHIEKDTSR